MEVAENMDGLAWARVSRKVRPAEIAEAYDELSGAHESTDGQLAADADCDADAFPYLTAPGILRKVPYPLASISAAMEALADGPRATAFTKGLSSFMCAQNSLDEDVALDSWPEPTKSHWRARQHIVESLRQGVKALHSSSTEPDFMSNCMHAQELAFKGRNAAAFGVAGVVSDVELDQHTAAAETDPEAGIEVPVAWVEPTPGTFRPSEYMDAYLRSIPPCKQPTAEQLQFLALFAKRLDNAMQEEDQCIPWQSRSQHCMLLLGQGGCGKTYLVQSFIARLVKYAYRTPDAVRMIALSNAQAANLSTAEFPAYTMHRACRMVVQKLKNSLMDPKEKLQNSSNSGNPPAL